MKHRTRLSQEERERIESLYSGYDRTLEDIAGRVGRAISTVRRCLIDEGVYVPGARSRLEESKIEEIIAAYHECKGNGVKIARKLNLPQSRVYQCLFDENLKPGGPICKKRRQEYEDMYAATNGNATKAARILGDVTRQTVLNNWRKLGYTIRKQGQWKDIS